MTGFARVSGATANFRWAWELKSVNAKGLDLRLRLPPGFDAIETEARAAAIKQAYPRHLLRDAYRRSARPQCPRSISTKPLLRRLVEAISQVGHSDALRPASIDGLLGVRGVVEIRDTGDEESDLAQVAARCAGGSRRGARRARSPCAERRARRLRKSSASG